MDLSFLFLYNVLTTTTWVWYFTGEKGKKEKFLIKNSLQVNQVDLCQRKQKSIIFHICSLDYTLEQENTQLQILKDVPEFCFSVHSILSVLI